MGNGAHPLFVTCTHTYLNSYETVPLMDFEAPVAILLVLVDLLFCREYSNPINVSVRYSSHPQGK